MKAFMKDEMKRIIILILVLLGAPMRLPLRKSNRGLSAFTKRNNSMRYLTG